MANNIGVMRKVKRGRVFSVFLANSRLSQGGLLC